MKKNILILLAVAIIIVIVAFVEYQNIISNEVNSLFNSHNSTITPSSSSSPQAYTLGLLNYSVVDSILGGSWQTQTYYQGGNLSKIPALHGSETSGMLSGGFEELKYNNQTLNLTFVKLNTTAYADAAYSIEMSALNATTNGTIDSSTYAIRVNKLGGQEIIYAKYYNNIIIFFYSNSTGQLNATTPTVKQAIQLLSSELST
ncbi:MAG: hypothetical protein M1538_03040 [Candidatus Marsarchaeota archaeon]|nr:hypothetical protein [Candidatus Marsarchaeota archaeon]